MSDISELDLQNLRHLIGGFATFSTENAKSGTMAHKEPRQDNIARSAYFSISSGSISLTFGGDAV